REFASEEWHLIRPKLWEKAFEEAEDKADYDQKLNITGTDIDHRMIQIAKDNSLEAGLADIIDWKQVQVKDLIIRDDNGYLVGNPPYGQRISDRDSVSKLYEDLGKTMKEHPSWSVYILTAFEDFEKHYNQKATKKRKLFNGFIQTNYYQYFGVKQK